MCEHKNGFTITNVCIHSLGYERMHKKIGMRSHIKPGGLSNKSSAAFAIYLCMAVGKKSERVWPRPTKTRRDLTCSQKANSETYCSLFPRQRTATHRLYTCDVRMY